MAQPYKPINPKELTLTLQQSGSAPRTPKRNTAKIIVENDTSEHESDQATNNAKKLTTKTKKKKQLDLPNNKYKKLPQDMDQIKKKTKPKIMATQDSESEEEKVNFPDNETNSISEPTENDIVNEVEEDLIPKPLSLEELEIYMHTSADYLNLNTHTRKIIDSSLNQAKQNETQLRHNIIKLKKSQMPSFEDLKDLRSQLLPLIEKQEEMIKLSTVNSRAITDTSQIIKDLVNNLNDKSKDQDALQKQTIISTRENNVANQEVRKEIKDYMYAINKQQNETTK